MRAVLVNAELELARRRHLGIDRLDELVVEICSPDDETRAKLPFYAALGMAEALIVHRDRRVELHRLDDSGAYHPVADGRSAVLGATFSTVDGPRLRVAWDGGSR